MSVDSYLELFTTLFGGGAAELQLVESDDPLEAGLEILCQPPGKKLATLSLLSGGEQTLTALALIFGVFLVLLVEKLSRRGASFHNTSHRKRLRNVYRLRGWRAAVAVMFCVMPLVFGFLLPAGIMLYMALTSGDAQFGARYITLTRNTVTLAAVTAALAVLLALVVGYAGRTSKTPLVRWSNRIAGLGYAVPGAVIAVGVLIPFAWFDNTLDAWMREHFDIATGLLLSGTLIAVVFAYLVRFLPVALNTLDAGLGKIKPTMDDVGRSMGLSPLQILRRVHVPLLQGSLLTASLLVFVDVLKELPATLILRPFNFNTLAIRTYELANQERLAEASSSALMIVLAGIIPVIILSKSISRSRPGHDSST
mgnify:CR=1 FL=1